MNYSIEELAKVYKIESSNGKGLLIKNSTGKTREVTINDIKSIVLDKEINNIVFISNEDMIGNIKLENNNWKISSSNEYKENYIGKLGA